MTNNKKPSQQEMIDAIYEKIARKDLSFGCRIDLGIAEGVVYRTTQGGGIVDFFIGIQLKSAFTQELIKNSQIIGHPVMIGDVLDYFQENPIGIFELYGVEFNSQGRRNLPKNIFILWKNKRKPIEEQDDECIEFVYNLISE